jgi:hypothetical protein
MSSETTNVLWWTATINAGAVLIAPAIALWAQRRIDRYKAAQDRREAIFKALWVNRKRPFYIARIDALNMIDIEFYKYKHVRDAWKDLFAHYRDPHPGLNDEQIGQQREELFTTLVFEASKVIGYDFGRAEIRDNSYVPTLHGKIEETEIETRTRILDLLRGDALPVKFVHVAAPEEPNREASPQ